MQPEPTWRVACHGEAQGRVVLVRAQTDLAEFKGGDILVAAQTDMNYTPQMLVASAVVTEEGGRYSHASIFCRENGIPCIVGVKGALNELPNLGLVRLDTSGPTIEIVT